MFFVNVPFLAALISYCLLASMVSGEKSAIKFTEDPLNIMLLLSFCFQDSFIISWWCAHVESILLWVFWASCIYTLIFLSDLGRRSPYFLQILFLSLFSFWDSMEMCTGWLWAHRYRGPGGFYPFIFISVPQTAEAELTCLQVIWFFLLPLKSVAQPL